MGETTQVVHKPVISQEEKRGIVRGFVKGFLSGSVKVTIWEEATVSITTMEELPAKEKLEFKSHTNNLINTVSGSRPATDEEVETAVDSLFSWIVTLRSGGFITGEFVGPPDWESRLSELKERVSSIEKLFEELLQRSKIQSSV
jgi:hypothetical protein